MGQLQLTCLGDFQIMLDGEPITAFQTDKVRAMLIYLLIEEQAHQRSALAPFLWPGYSEESANNSLRQSLHRLRHLLRNAESNPPWLLITRQTVQVNPAAAIQIDAVRFTKLLADCATHQHAQLLTCQPCLARLRQAIDLYRGDFLRGFTVADSDPFEEWRCILQEQLHLQALDTLTHLANAAAQVGDEEGVLQAAHRQLALEPWLEAAHRRIMRILAGRGQRTAALAQYQRCRQVLLEELHIQPDAETNALYEQIRSSTLPEPTPKSPPRASVVQDTLASVPRPQPAPTAPPPFLAGRVNELAQLESWCAEAGAGQGRLGFVVGEAGSGKTTLLRAFMAQAQTNQPTLSIATGGCDEYIGNGLPFLPWRALFQQLTSSGDANWLPTPALAAAADPTSTLADDNEPQLQVTQDQLFTEIGTRLITLAAQQPLVLILEDLHWADQSSLHLLLYLSQRVAGSRLLLLCSFRPEEVATTGEERQHPLLKLMNESKRRFGQVLIDLSALSETVRQQFIADWLDQEPNQLGRDFRQALFHHTEGHALFTIELLQELQARGDLQRNAVGAWVARPSLQWPALPARVEGVIESRMARLPSHLRHVLRVAAIEGEDFTAEVVSQVAAIPLAQVELWLSDELDRRYRLINVQHTQWIGPQRLSFYRFRHHLFQQYLYQSLNPIEQATYHAQVGQVLEACYGEQRSAIALQLARHFEQAGLSNKAIDYYKLAGEKASELSANTEAISHFRTALTLLQVTSSLPNPAERELAIQLVLGNALVRVYGYAAAEVGQAFHRAHLLYQQVRAFPQSNPTISTQQYGTLLHGLHRFYYMHGEWLAARQVGEQLMELAQQSQTAVLQAEAPRALGMTLWHQGEFTTAQQHFEQGIAAYTPTLHTSYLQLSGQDPGMICTAYTAWGMWMLGYPTQAAERLARCLALATTFDHPFTLIYALQYAAVLHQFRRDAAATLTQVEAIIALAQQHGFTYYLGWGAILRGWARVQQGQQAAGIAELQQGLASWQATGATLAQHYYYGLLADAYLTLGQPEAGLNAVDEGLAAIPRSGRFWEAELYRLQGELLLRQSTDQAAQAEAAFQQAITIARQQGAKLLELRAICSASSLWQRQGKRATAHQWLQSSYDWFTEGFDTVDLRAAQTLQAEISPISKPPAIAPHHHAANAVPPVIGNLYTLPVQLTPLIGRTQEVAELTARLQNPDVRLLTLVGAGGMGKTRLAIEVGRTTQTAFADGVCFVELAAVRTATALASAIVTALGLPLQSGEPRNLLLQTLRRQQLLLILDNFEQLLGPESAAVDLLVDLLIAAPALQILVTSRERLRLRHEQIYTVQALAFAPAATPADAADMAAVRLFVQAVQRFHADFRLTAENLLPVLRICQLVQGMPLGLELAAANVDQLSLAHITDAIAQRAEFLAVDWRDMPERQRSMGAVFRWSWHLLDDQERQVLRQLAVFQGSFTRAAAETIAGATVPVLTRLWHKSLLQLSTPTAVDGRYQIHELLRQFAAAELATAQEAAATATRHSTYYLSFLATQQPAIMHDAPREATAAIQAELDNIRQAWRWGAGHLPAALVAQGALALREFYWLAGLITEAIEMFTLAMRARAAYQQQQSATLLRTEQSQTPPASQPTNQPDEMYVYSILVGMTAAFQLAVGHHEETFALATAMIGMAPAASNPAGAAFGYMLQGQALRRQGKSSAALQLLTDSVTLARQERAVNPSLMLDIEKRAYSWLASIALSSDDYAAARDHAVHQLEICQQFKMRVGEVIAFTCVVDVDKALGDYPRAQQYAEQALATARQNNFLLGQALCSEQLAELAWRQGDYQQAFRLYEQVLALYRPMDQVLSESNIAQMLGRLCLCLGDIVQAQQWIEHTFHLLQRLGLPARETSWAYASRARLHYCTDNLSQALADAETAWAMVRELDGGASQAEALVLLGLVREGEQQSAAAATAYREALMLYTALGHRHHSAEPRAGLARIALANGAPDRALAEVEEVLIILQSHPLAGFDEPFQVYLTCYRVLAANQDRRAPALITTAHKLMMAYADRIVDPVIRRSFLENVASHRAVQAAFVSVQAETSRAVRASVRTPRVDSEAVGQSNSRALHDPVAQPLSDWGEMPTVEFFTGRSAALAQLTAWLTPADNRPPARLISILGLGGMGKTTLAAAVTKAVAPSYTVVIWRSLLNAPPLAELLQGWLQTLARYQLTALPASLDEQLRLLFDYLRQEPCLLILDNCESIFTSAEAMGRAGVTRTGYEGYDQLLQRLATSEHQSCLLLTSREQPYALNRLGRQAHLVQVLRLGGLDAQAGQALLQSNGLVTSAAEAAMLVDNYSGNPLALQIAAATIADFFGGDVAAFQQEEGALFDGIRLVLDQQFARLTPLERDILIWLAVERQEATPATVRANFVRPVPSNKFIEALQALQSRALLETRAGNLTLSNVIVEYMTAYLIEQVYQEIVDDKMTRWQDGRVTGWQGDKVTESPNYPVTLSPPHPVTLSFLNRFALLKAQGKEHVRQSQQRLILQPLADRLLAQHSKAQLGLLVQGLLETLRQITPPAAGYAAGNLLNLLLRLDVDLTAYDFSALQIWQVHLRNANATGLRLTDAHLRDATFSDDFSSIQTLAFHPTDELLAAGATDGAIYLWQTADWQRVGVLSGHRNAVRTLAFAPSSVTAGAQSLLVSGGSDGQIRFWHLQDGRGYPGQMHQRQGYIRALAFSPDGAHLASGGDDQTVCLWAAASGDLRHQLTGHQGRIYGVAWCAPLAGGPYQGRALVISGGEDTHVHLWDADRGARVAVLAAHQHPIRALACLSDVRIGGQGAGAAWLATADESGVIYLWDLHTLRPHHHWQEDRTVIRALSFSATGALLASAGDNGLVRIWEPLQGRLLQTIQAHARAVATATFSAQSPSLLATNGYDRLIRLWNATNGQALQVLHGYRNKAYVAHFQPPAGKLLATGHADGMVRLWQFDAGTPRLQRQLVGHSSNVFTLAFSPEGARLASGSNDGTILLWDSTTGQQLRTLSGHSQDIYSVAFSPDGQLLVSTSPDQTIRLWDAQSGREVRRFANGGCTSWSAIFHPNGEWVASGDFDQQVRLWEVATGRLLQTWSGHQWEIEKVAFSPDGAWLASAGHDGTIRLWAVASGTTARVLEGHTAPLWSVAFSPDGNRLVSCGEDLTVRLWDLHGAPEEAVPCQILTGHTEEIFTAVFHPDGDLVASASGDGSVCFWETRRGALRHQLTVPGPYAGMEITGVTGISEGQKAALRALGAVEE